LSAHSRSIKPDGNTPQPGPAKINAKFEEAGPAHRRTKAYSHDQRHKRAFSMLYTLRRPFYDELWNSWRSEPVIVQVLEGEGAIAKNREVMAQPTQPTPQLAPSRRIR